MLPRQNKAAIEDGLARLLRVYEVRSLNLSTLGGCERGDGFGFENVSHSVKWCTGLVRLDLQLELESELGIQQLGHVLQECTALRELNLARNRYFDSDVKMLAKVLAGTPITSLDLRYNHIGQRGSEELGQFLATCRTLQELHLSHNSLGEQGVRCFAHALETSSSTLRTANLEHVDMGDGGAEAFAQVVAQLVAVEEINVKWNHIGEQGMTALAHALTSAKRLRMLNISDNQVGAAAALLGDVLQACPELSDLRMNSIDLRDAGAESIEAAWRPHARLTRLDMHSNKLDTRGIKSIARWLLRYGKLRVLYLSKNDSHEEPAWASLRVCLAQLTELQRLALRESSLRRSTMQTMALGVANLKALRCLSLDGTSATTTWTGWARGPWRRPCRAVPGSQTSTSRTTTSSRTGRLRSQRCSGGARRSCTCTLGTATCRRRGSHAWSRLQTHAPASCSIFDSWNNGNKSPQLLASTVCPRGILRHCTRAQTLAVMRVRSCIVRAWMLLPAWRQLLASNVCSRARAGILPSKFEDCAISVQKIERKSLPRLSASSWHLVFCPRAFCRPSSRIVLYWSKKSNERR